MKYVQEDIAGMGHKRKMFALGRFEAEILHGLIVNGISNTPETPHTKLLIARMKNMKKVIGESLPIISKSRDGYPTIPKMQ